MSGLSMKVSLRAELNNKEGRFPNRPIRVKRRRSASIVQEGLNSNGIGSSLLRFGGLETAAP
jgi:hypothetical protein